MSKWKLLFKPLEWLIIPASIGVLVLGLVGLVSACGENQPEVVRPQTQVGSIINIPIKEGQDATVRMIWVAFPGDGGLSTRCVASQIDPGHNNPQWVLSCGLPHG